MASAARPRPSEKPPPVTTPPDSASAANGDAVLERLRRLHPKRIDLSLGRMERLLARLGNPEQALPPVIHIAGTNGKGSTTAYLKAALEAAGYGVHVYTSPHLVRFHERISLAGPAGAPGGAQPICDHDLMDILIECEIANGDAPITYFEVTTAAAFLAFSRTTADVVLLEVGLGGRLDATNVIARPALCILTPISIDHVQFLGDDLAGIAFEKAGILKPDVPCVVAAQAVEALRVIEARADTVGAPLIRCGDDWRIGDVTPAGFEITLGDQVIELPLPALPGAHQIANAGLAVAALISLDGFDVDAPALASGLTDVSWPARLQRLENRTLLKSLPDGAELWLDGGHNSAAGEALAEVVRGWAAADVAPCPLYLIAGMMNVKDVTAFLSSFAGLARAVVGIDIPGEVNALSADDIRRNGERAGLPTHAAADLTAALAHVNDDCIGGPPPRVLICGSLYLAGSVLAAEQGRAKSPSEVSA